MSESTRGGSSKDRLRAAGGGSCRSCQKRSLGEAVGAGSESGESLCLIPATAKYLGEIGTGPESRPRTPRNHSGAYKSSTYLLHVLIGPNEEEAIATREARCLRCASMAVSRATR